MGKYPLYFGTISSNFKNLFNAKDCKLSKLCLI